MDFFQVSIESLRDLIYFYRVRYLLKLNKFLGHFVEEIIQRITFPFPWLGTLSPLLQVQKLDPLKKLQ